MGFRHLFHQTNIKFPTNVITCTLLTSLDRHFAMKKTIYILISFILTSCGQSSNQKLNTIVPDTIPINNTVVTTNRLNPDSFQLKETFNQEDLPVNEYFSDRLKPIRANFKRINTITNWSSVDTMELSESTEGGEARFYYQNNKLAKIVARHYGETFQLLTEYYLLNGQLSFVFEKRYKYNRPIYYNATSMKEHNDTTAFDFDKSEIIEDRSYFENGTLFHQINNQDCGSPFSKGYLLKEQGRIMEEFDGLIKQAKK